MNNSTPKQARYLCNLKRQSGQAAVFVFIFMTILVIGMSVLYKTGKLTTDKIALQNAADAAAYSVSVVEARDLNFASYMNRAIVANEVAIGQLVGLASWAFHWRSFNDYLSLYSTPLKTPPITPLGSALEGMAKGFKVSGDVFIKLLKPLAEHGTKITHNINKVYGYAQYGFHVASTVYALGALSEMIDQNAPDGARLSEYGLLSLIGHLATYGALPGLPGEKFTRNYNPTKAVKVADFQADIAGDTDAGGYGRMAALIYGSSDIFVKGRGWTFDFFKVMHEAKLIPDFLYTEQSDGSGWVGLNVGDNINLGIFEVEWKFWLLFHLDLSRVGGSELRMAVPLTGKNKGKAAGQFLNWSSADTTNLGMGFDAGFSVKAWIIIPIIDKRIKVVDVGGSAKIYNDRLKVFVNLTGSGSGCEEDDGDPDTEEECEDIEGEEGLEIINTGFPTRVPFGAGFAQVGQEKGTGTKKVDSILKSNKKHMGSENSLTPLLRGPVPVEAYGTAANALLAWEFPTPPGIYYQAGMAQRQMKTYGGLPRYVDTANNSPMQGSGGPNLVVNVILGEEEFDLGVPEPSQPAQPETEPTGRFEITEKMANDQISVLAKSEVYFKRPTDLSYFKRGDDQEEYGSTFNPYWQARLIETSHADRTTALLLQQGVNMEGVTPPFALSSLFAPLISLLGI